MNKEINMLNFTEALLNIFLEINLPQNFKREITIKVTEEEFNNFQDNIKDRYENLFTITEKESLDNNYIYCGPNGITLILSIY